MEKDKIILHYLTNKREEDAFNLIVEVYHRKLYWHIRRIVICHSDADDVLQNTFIKVWKNLSKFRKDSKIYTWLYRIATNESLTHLKSKSKINLMNNEAEYYLQNAKSVDVNTSASDIQRKLELAIATLPEKQRIVFNLRYFEELKHEEIAQITDTSVSGVKTNYHLAVKKIENYIRQYSE